MSVYTEFVVYSMLLFYKFCFKQTSFNKKKRLRTRKERDKHNCSGTKDDSKKPASNIHGSRKKRLIKECEGMQKI